MALDSLRKSAGGVIGVIFVLLLIASFIIWFPAGWFQGFGSQDLITVGDTKIGPREYMRAQQDVLRAMSSQAGRSLSLQEARALGLDSRVMERLIGGAAVDAHARALHLAIGDTAILDEIMKDPAFKDPSGNFSPALFQQTLQAMGINEQGYIDSLRERNLRRQILSTVGKVAAGPDVLVTALNNFNGETRTLRYVLVPQSAAGTIPDPTDEDLKRYYDNHRGKFTQPEYRKIGVLAVTPETVKNEVQIKDSDVRAAFEASKDQLGTPEKRHVQQISFPDKAAADAAYQKIQSGTDFAAVAKEQGVSDADIDLGKVTRAELADPAMGDAAFKLEQNKVSEPITGSLGSVVLLRVTEIEPGKSPSFEEAKADLEKKILKERASGAIFDLHDKIEDQLASGSKLSEIADKLKLNYVLIDQVDRQGKKPDGSTVTLPAQKDVLNAVFSTDVGVENDPIDAKDDGVIWYEVLGVIPEQLKPFDQVKDEATKDWKTEEVHTQLAKYTQDLVNSLSGGKSLEDVAKDLNQQVLTSDPLKRDSITVNVLPAAVAQAFSLPEKGYGSAPSGVEEGRIVFQVDKVTPPPQLNPSETARLKQQIGQLIGEDVVAEYFSALENRYGVSVNEQALAKLVGTSEEP
ncbi:MAG TPA: peptidyl-prolyl cis-trans isomerase [Methyloceanibacter sp.]|nr:peptidyl-prolyl cis-trans isomerase [Methyloceanibacter sp.]